MHSAQVVVATRYTTFITGPGRSFVDVSFSLEVMDPCVVAVNYPVISTFHSGRENTT